MGGKGINVGNIEWQKGIWTVLLEKMCCLIVVLSIFTDSALWAGSVIESPCPSVCLFVCLSVCAIGCSFFGEVFFTS